MGLACEPPLYLFRNKFGLHLCQQRPPFRESQTQFRKTKVRALNDGQNSVALLDRLTLVVDQPCFDDQPHGLAPSIARLVSLLYKKPALRLEAHAALVASLPNFCALSNHFFRIFGSTFLIAGVAAWIGHNQAQPTGTTININGGTSDTLTSAAAQSLSQTTQTIRQRNMNIQPTLRLEPGQRITMITRRDMKLSPTLVDGSCLQ
jgi:hypothetical protein